MLGKLMKYEFKATSRTFLPIYIALVLVAVINRIFRMGNIDIGFGVSTLVLFGLFMALGILTLIMIIQRFNKNLLGDEGYLMFTLPVNSMQLIGSKLMTSLVWTIISGIVACVTFIILVGDVTFFYDTITNWDVLWDTFMQNTQQGNLILDIILPMVAILTTMLLSYISFILKVYLSLAAAQLPIFNKHRGIISFIVFFVINAVVSMVGRLALICVPVSIMSNFSSVLSIIMLGSAIMAILLFLGTKYILDKHLNLE